jgi:hypothetical protein
MSPSETSFTAELERIGLNRQVANGRVGKVAIEAHQKTVLPLAKARKVALGVAESSHQGLEAESYGCLKKIVAETTGRPADINKISRPWLNAIVKGGRLLTKMAEMGERVAIGGDGRNQYRGSLRGVTTLSDLGFTRPRAARWQLAGALPDSLRMDPFFATFPTTCNSTLRVMLSS